MIPQKGQQVSIYLKQGGVRLDGTVVSWSDKKTVLSTPNQTAFIIINKTKKEVLFYKIIIEATNLKNKIEIPEQAPLDIDDYVALKTEMNNLEKQEIKEKLSSHETSDFRKVEYGNPFITANTMQYPAKETSVEHSQLGQKLRKVLSKSSKK